MYLLDSNILIGFLNGSAVIGNWVKERKINREMLCISVISKIEVLSLKDLKDEQVNDVEKFLNSFLATILSNDIISLSAALRRKGGFSLGDAIILASAIESRAVLVTNDLVFKRKAKEFAETLSIV